MSFFEPLPPEPPEPSRAWSPPIWDRPSEGTLGVVVPIGEIVHRSDDFVAVVDLIRAYPNGFTVTVGVHTNPRVEQSRARSTLLRAGGGPAAHAERFPRVGLRFADGRTAGRTATAGPHNVTRDAAGIPTEPIIQMMGGGGGSHGYRFDFWVFPLPPEGPVEIFASLPAIGVDEVKVVVDGRAIREAGSRALAIWD